VGSQPTSAKEENQISKNEETKPNKFKEQKMVKKQKMMDIIDKEDDEKSDGEHYCDD
jgi:hypothetical protein